MMIEEVEVEKKFVPVRITLESKKELAALWYITNMGPETTLQKYTTARGSHSKDLIDFKGELWDGLNEFHEEGGGDKE